MAISDSEKPKENCELNQNPIFVSNNTSLATNSSMEYAWLESSKRDPLITDTNLAEIDFENFRNEDLAYAFSCGEEESGSSTDMSICRSEALFSSMRESSAQMSLTQPGQECSLIQDSLLEEVDQGLVQGNKNNYQLTYSSHMMSIDPGAAAVAKIMKETHDKKSRQIVPSSSETKLTTWSNLGSNKQKSRSQSKDSSSTENSFNNNSNSNNNTNSINAKKYTKSLPDLDKDEDDVSQTPSGDNRHQFPITPTESNLVNNFMKNRSGGDIAIDQMKHLQFEYDDGQQQIPMMRSKDSVNQFLKAASAAASGVPSVAKLCSIDEKNEDHLNKSFKQSKPKESSADSFACPDLSFLENDVGLWDAFFMHSKNTSKFQSVLQPPPPLPIEDYLAKTLQTKREIIIEDVDSLRELLPDSYKHLLPEENARSSSPITQVCNSLSHFNISKTPTNQEEKDLKNEAIKTMSNQNGKVQMVKVKEAWAETPEKETVVLRHKNKQRQGKNNLNFINNNDNKIRNNEANDETLKRRSYHNPQEQLFKVFASSSKKSQRRRKPSDFPKSGSQNDLCDARTPEEDSQEKCDISRQSRMSNNCRNSAAEYPIYTNLCTPRAPFDISHKRKLFAALYTAVERFLAYSDGSINNSQGIFEYEPCSIQYILFYEICPALHAIMMDGMKPEVITSFGKMHTTVWRLIEAIIRQGSAASLASNTSICDLIMLLNAKFNSQGEDERKFAGFVAGLLNMSSLHIWFSKLKWSMDVLLRFYERHAFICALQKETKLLFDEFLYCLQRLYSIPFNIEMPFSLELLDQVPSANYYQQQHSGTCSSCRTSYLMEDETDFTTTNTLTSPNGSNSSRHYVPRRGSKSRIPRPVSLPKRLEAKLGSSPSPIRGKNVRTGDSGRPPAEPLKAIHQSEGKPPITPRKSRVRDTIRLFDSRNSRNMRAPLSAANMPVKLRKPPIPRFPSKHRHSGAGEAIASEIDSSEGR